MASPRRWSTQTGRCYACLLGLVLVRILPVRRDRSMSVTCACTSRRGLSFAYAAWDLDENLVSILIADRHRCHRPVPPSQRYLYFQRSLGRPQCLLARRRHILDPGDSAQRESPIHRSGFPTGRRLRPKQAGYRGCGEQSLAMRCAPDGEKRRVKRSPRQWGIL